MTGPGKILLGSWKSVGNFYNHLAFGEVAVN